MNIKAEIVKHEELIKVLNGIKAQGKRINAMRRDVGESQSQFSARIEMERYAKKLMEEGYSRKLKSLKNFTK